MSESQEHTPDPFNVESFRGKIIHIVHKKSVMGVADGSKPADQSDVSQAIIVLKRIEQLIQSGIPVQEIDDLNNFESPEGFDTDNDSLILGGAFFGQCIEAYANTLDRKGISYNIHPLLTVRA